MVQHRMDDKIKSDNTGNVGTFSNNPKNISIDMKIDVKPTTGHQGLEKKPEDKKITNEANDKEAEDKKKEAEKQEELEKKNAEQDAAEKEKTYKYLSDLYSSLVKKTDQSSREIINRDENAKKLAQLKKTSFKSSANALEDKVNEHEILIQAYNAQKGKIKSGLDRISKKNIKWDNIYKNQNWMGKALGATEQVDFLKDYVGYDPSKKPNSATIIENMTQLLSLSESMLSFRMSGPMLDAMNGIAKNKNATTNNIDDALSKIGVTGLIDSKQDVSAADLKTFLENMEQASEEANKLEEPQAANMIMLCAAYKLAQYRERCTGGQYKNELSSVSPVSFYKTADGCMKAVYNEKLKAKADAQNNKKSLEEKRDSIGASIKGKSDRVVEADANFKKATEQLDKDNKTRRRAELVQGKRATLEAIVKANPVTEEPSKSDPNYKTKLKSYWAYKTLTKYNTETKAYEDENGDMSGYLDHVNTKESLSKVNRACAEQDLKEAKDDLDNTLKMYANTDEEVTNSNQSIADAGAEVEHYSGFSEDSIFNNIYSGLQDISGLSQYVTDENFFYYFDQLQKMKQILSSGTSTALLLETRSKDILQDISSSDYDKELQNDSQVKAYLSKFSTSNISMTNMSAALGIEDENDPKSKKEKSKKVESRRKREQDIKKSVDKFNGYFTTNNSIYSAYDKNKGKADDFVNKQIDNRADKEKKKYNDKSTTELEKEKWESIKALATAHQKELGEAQTALETCIMSGISKFDEPIQKKLKGFFDSGKHSSDDIFGDSDKLVIDGEKLSTLTRSDYEKIYSAEYQKILKDYIALGANRKKYKNQITEADKKLESLKIEDLKIDEYLKEDGGANFKIDKAFEKTLIDKRASSVKDTYKNATEAIPNLFSAAKHIRETIAHGQQASLLKGARANIQKLAQEKMEFDKQFFNLAIASKDKLKAVFGGNEEYKVIENAQLADIKDSTLRANVVSMFGKLVDKETCPSDIKESFKGIQTAADKSDSSSLISAQKDSQTMKMISAQIKRSNISAISSFVDVIGDMSKMLGNGFNAVNSVLAAEFYKSKSGSYSTDLDNSLNLSLKDNAAYKKTKLGGKVLKNFVTPFLKHAGTIAKALGKKQAMKAQKATMGSLLERELEISNLPTSVPNQDELRNSLKRGRELNQLTGRSATSLYLPSFGGSAADQAGKSAYVMQALKQYATFSQLGGSVPSVIKACVGKMDEKDDARKVALLRALACYRA